MSQKGFVKWSIALAPALVWGWIILKLLLLSAGELPKFPILLNIPYFDKLVHAVLFGAWAAALLWADKQLFQLRMIIPIILAAVFVYGGSLELIQEFRVEGRSGTYGDLIADCVGAGAVLLVGRRLI